MRKSKNFTKRITALVERRDQIIFRDGYNPNAYRDGLRCFECLRRHELRLLMYKCIYDPYPFTKYMEFVWFMERYWDDNELYLHGFVYSPEREDGFGGRLGGISLEGIGRDKRWTKDEPKKVFRFLFGKADEFRLNPPYVWYD